MNFHNFTSATRQLVRTIVPLALLAVASTSTRAQSYGYGPENCYLNGSLEISTQNSQTSYGNTFSIMNSSDPYGMPDTVFAVSATGQIGINRAPSGNLAVDANGTIRATSFSGDGSGLTGINVSSGLWNVPTDSSKTWYDGRVAVGHDYAGAQLDVNSSATTQPFFARVDGVFAAGVYTNKGMAIGASPSNGPHANGLVVDGMTSIGTKGWGAKFFVMSGTNEHPAQFYSGTDRAFIVLKNKGIAIGGGLSAPENGGNFGGSVEIGLSSGYSYSLVAGATKITDDLIVTGDVCASNLTCPSDARYKTRIQPLGDALQQVLTLRGVTYNWRTEAFPERNFNNEEQIGFIAQELETVFPQFVVTDDKGYKSVDYARLTPVLVEAIKEQQRLIQDLQRTTASLHHMSARMDAMERALEANNDATTKR